MENLKSYKSLILVFFALLCIASFLWMAKALLLGYYPDFVTQYTVPKLVFSGINPYVGGEGLYTLQVYPPTTFLVFMPFTIFSLENASFIYTSLSILSLVLSLYFLNKIFDIPFYSIKNFILLSLVFSFFPIKFTLGMGQVNIFILLLLTLCLWFIKKNREFLAGLVLGVSIAVKLFPLFLPLYFFIRVKKLPHEYKDKFHWSGLANVRIFNNKFWIWPSQINDNARLLLGIATGLLIFALLVIIFIPSELSIYFISDVLPTVASSWKLDYYNQALSGFVGRSFGTEIVGSIVKISLTILASIATIIAVSKNLQQDFQTVALKFGLFITVSLMINTFSWQHHFVWLIIPFYCTFAYILKENLSNKYLLFLFVAYLLVAINFKDPSVLPIIFQSHVLWGTLILFILSIRLLFLKQQK